MSTPEPTNGSTIGMVRGLAGVVRDVGFPIVVAAFLLWALPPRLKEWTQAMQDNAKTTQELLIRLQTRGEQLDRIERACTQTSAHP